MIELPVTYQHLAQDVRPGSRILINDGLIELAVERINGGAIDCKVLIGGTVTSHKGINLPGTRVSAPTLTDKDRDDIRFGVAEGVDYVRISAGPLSALFRTFKGPEFVWGRFLGKASVWKNDNRSGCRPCWPDPAVNSVINRSLPPA